MAVLNGVMTLVALLTFVGIVWWAFSKFRMKDNEQASMLPFAQPDEAAAQRGQTRGGYGQQQQGESHE